MQGDVTRAHHKSAPLPRRTCAAGWAASRGRTRGAALWPSGSFASIKHPRRRPTTHGRVRLMDVGDAITPPPRREVFGTTTWSWSSVVARLWRHDYVYVVVCGGSS
ncbi:hypothetical protein MRX96_003791 [Rhipicephalus microplus]